MQVEFKRAKLCHIEAMQTLVENEVEAGLILPRSADEMATNIRAYTLVFVNDILAGFVALHIYSQNLAEVRSLVISKDHRKKGLGKKLIEACKEEAKDFGIQTLLSLTYQKKLFEDSGFAEISKKDLPEHKVWADCNRCKHFPICDEIALVYKVMDKIK